MAEVYWDASDRAAIALMASEMPEFKAHAQKVAAAARAKASGHGNVASYIKVERFPDDPYYRFDYFVTNTHPHAIPLEVGHGFNFYSAGPILRPIPTGRPYWVPGIHLMRDTWKAL